VAEGLLIHPVEGALKLVTFAAEYNAIRLGGDLIEAAQTSGVNGVIDEVGAHLDRVSEVTSDPHVQSASWAAGLLALTLIAAPLALIVIGVQTFVQGRAFGAAIDTAPTWQEAMRIAGSREVRVFTISTLLLLALIGGKAIKDYTAWERTRSALPAEARVALESVPAAERAAMLEAASRMGLDEASVLRYIRFEQQLSPAGRQALQLFSWSERFRFQSTGVGLQKSLPPGEAQLFLERAGFDSGRAAEFIKSFPEGVPIELKSVAPGDHFLRYTDYPARRGSFATNVLFGSADEAVGGLFLKPYENRATFVQMLVATEPTFVLEGPIRGGWPGIVQTLIVDRGGFSYGEGIPFR